MDGSKLALPGTYRAAPFSETLARAMAVAPGLGITRVADVTGLDHIGIPVAIAVRPASRSLSVSQGKGLTPEAARVSAVMESIEFHHAEHVNHRVTIASAAELQPACSMAHLESLPLASNSRFHRDLRIPWIEAETLVGEGRTLVPFELVDLDFVTPCPYTDGCFVKTSGGLASGNTREEASLHALCELIEHDSEALWTMAGPSHRMSTRVDLESIMGDENSGLVERLLDSGMVVGVWDMTSDIGVAAYAAVIAEQETARLRRQPPTAGFGCHPDPVVAMSRALTEAIQSRVTFIAGSRDDVPRHDYVRLRDRSHLEAMSALLGDDHCPVRHEDAPSLVRATFADEVDATVDRLSARGLGRPLVVDLTRDGVDIPVVKLIAPGLEPERPEQDYLVAPLGPRGRLSLSSGGR